MIGEVLVPRKTLTIRDEIPAVHDVSVTAALRANGAGETAPMDGTAAPTSAAVGTVHKGLAGTTSLIGRCANPALENGADAHVPSRRDSSGRPAQR